MKLRSFLQDSAVASAMREASVVERYSEQFRLSDFGSDFQELANAASGMPGYEAIGSTLSVRGEVMRGLDAYALSHTLAAEIDVAGSNAADAMRSATSAIEAARRAGFLDLPNELEAFRQEDQALAYRALNASQESWWKDSYLESLNALTALSGLLDQSEVIGAHTLSELDHVLRSSDIALGSVRATWGLLEYAGLLRLPRYRRLTTQEKRRRIKTIAEGNHPSKQGLRAYSLIHRHERLLREIIAGCMEGVYGEDWAVERLPECGCKKLLGRPLGSDEEVLDQADFFHYSAIMCHPQHFAEVFSIGFDSPETIEVLLGRVREARKRSHHARTFTSENLRDLVLAVRAIEVGLSELIDDVVFEPLDE